MQLLLNILASCWEIMLDASPFMLFGFVMAGLLQAFVPRSIVTRYIGKPGPASVFKAAILGAPLPLCSCSVLPAAAGIRDQGASKGATMSFLISTPETGVDSIAVSWALLDPVMTVLRPVAAIITAAMAGLGVDILDRKEERKSLITPPPKLEPLQQESGCGCAGGCCGGATAENGEKKSILQRAAGGLYYAFTDLLGDIGAWFLLGVVIAGIITALLPSGSLADWLGTGAWPMLAALAVAVPLYVCATASTPLAAALVLKGLSPGAALIFLLAGPATNMATITVVAKLLGKRAAVIYVGCIVVASLALGALTNLLYTNMGLSTAGWLAEGESEVFGVVAIASAIVLLALIPWAWWKEHRAHAHAQ